MGQYTAIIEGTGQHHNGDENDADEMIKKFIQELVRKGHIISHASFTQAGREELPTTLPPEPDELPPTEDIN